jgi:hypothetical protein
MPSMMRPDLSLCAAIAAALVLGCAAGNSYPVIYDPMATPLHHASDAVGVAFAYLNAQTPEIAAPELHVAPSVDRVVEASANAANQFERRITQEQWSANRDRVVWIVEVHGDLLNLHNYPWTESGAPGTHGDIVIDDETMTILGIYPWAPNETAPPPGILL